MSGREGEHEDLAGIEEAIRHGSVELRDRFAMAALSTLANAWLSRDLREGGDEPNTCAARRDLVEEAYRIADAMMKARRKE